MKISPVTYHIPFLHSSTDADTTEIPNDCKSEENKHIYTVIKWCRTHLYRVKLGGSTADAFYRGDGQAVNHAQRRQAGIHCKVAERRGGEENLII